MDNSKPIALLQFSELEQFIMLKPILIFLFSILCFITVAQKADNEGCPSSKRLNRDSVFHYTIATKGATIRQIPNSVSPAIRVFSTSDTVGLIDYENGYWRIKYADIYGYISELYIEPSIISNAFKDSVVTKKLFDRSINEQIDSLNKEIYKLNCTTATIIRQLENAKDSLQLILTSEKLKLFEVYSLEDQWELLMQIPGCLGGSEYNLRDTTEFEHCILLSEIHWVFFLQQPESQIVPFLISKLSYSSETAIIHTCPFYLSTQGELAVYCLQYIFDVNWYELTPAYYVFKNIEKKGIDFSKQYSLWDILDSQNKYKRMKSLWNRQWQKRLKTNRSTKRFLH